MSAELEIIDRRFANLLPGSGHLDKLWTGARWTEGPVYFGDADVLLFSDIPNNRMLRLTPSDNHVSVFRAPSDYTNGNTRDREGRLVSCQHGQRRVVRTEHDGSLTVIADSYEGKRLNSPNDVVVKSDGSVWFTDPSYGILSDYEGHKSEMEQDGCFVYRADPNGGLQVVCDDFVKPNGLAFSPDESVFYVADSGVSHDPDAPHHIRAFDVGGDGKSLSNDRVFAVVEPGLPDGFRLDTDGRLWTSAHDGVHCYTPDGDLLGKILVPEIVSNVTFGGPKRNRLFIMGTTSVYARYTFVNGAQRP